ncbi:S41 family peptidase [Hymenobacter negativus]|uniref:S41 family peptidase n=1 Tax=Hymenobacter negativus TaxID=2795026 RepID=A0ABS3QLH3_9BACT|nr:S41 family peptidase [Hymenobacter negativus]MBO2012103.1 S41 family peptidase [Hymenobacter negativus]
MKKAFLLALLLCLMRPAARAQNPVSYPADTLISKPELNFEVLWHTFEDNYAFFQLRGIDWHQTYRRYRPRVSARTSPDSLYAVFSAMLAPFQDNHINVIMPGVKQFKSVKPSQFAQEFPTDSLRDRFWALVDQTLARQGFGPMQTLGPEFRGQPLFRYTVSPKVAYLRFNRCFVDPDADNKVDAVALGKLLDTLFPKLNKAQSLLIDVRDNIGGNDEFGFELAGRFTGQKVKAMYKQTRKRGGGYEELEAPETWYIEPRGPVPYAGPVVLLTNDKTVSAGDVFALIMKELPRTQLIGENTRGIYSDMYGFTLPNKWLISLSNQRYYNAQKVCYEGTGTPVDVTVKNTRQDLTRGADPVVTRALAELKKRPATRY